MEHEVRCVTTVHGTLHTNCSSMCWAHGIGSSSNRLIGQSCTPQKEVGPRELMWTVPLSAGSGLLAMRSAGAMTLPLEDEQLLSEG